MTLVRCPRDACDDSVAVDVDPGDLRKVDNQATFMGLDSEEVTCANGHTFYVHH